MEGGSSDEMGWDGRLGSHDRCGGDGEGEGCIEPMFVATAPTLLTKECSMAQKEYSTSIVK